MEPPFARPFHLTSLAFSSVVGRRALLAVGRSNGFVNMYSLHENSTLPMTILLRNAAVHLSFSPITHLRPSLSTSAFLSDQEILMIGDDAGNVNVYAIDWPKKRDRDVLGFSRGYMHIARISVHSQQVCGLAWSPDGKYFATGGNDNICCLFRTSQVIDPRAPESTFRSDKVLHMWQLSAAVKAIAFCPWQAGLLAVGGGSNDRAIHFYHTLTGAALAIIDCAAQVTSLSWSSTRHEIAATFGFAQPDHPYRIAVYSWPACRQVLAVPWTNDLRALYAVPYPRSPPPCETGRRRRRETFAQDQRKLALSGRLDGCLVVAASDGTIRFQDVWSDGPERQHDGAFGPVGVGGHGLLGGSDILEGLHGVDKDDKLVIR